MSQTSAPQFSAADPMGGGELRLPRPPGVIRRFWTRHPVLADTVLALVVSAFAISGTIRIERAASESAWLTGIAVALALVGVAGIYLRRTRPLLTAALSGASVIALIWSPADTVLAPAVFAVYAVAVNRSTHAGAVTAAALWGLSILAVSIGEYVVSPGRVLRAAGDVDAAASDSLLSFATGIAMLLALALAIGANVGNRQRYLAALIDRARQLAVERDQQGQLATAAERARIAREMHDIVSHSLTVMVALAEGSSVAAGQDAPQAATAMRSVADTGRAAMVDMRRMLGVLGGSDADTAPQPGVADLRDLVNRFRALKVPVAFRGEGPPPRDPAVQLTVYRLVQESLTNALRYSEAPTEVLVTVARRGDRLTVTVTDDGLGGAGMPPKPAGSGRGLMGLRERVATVGGTVTAGPRTDGRGWRLQATIPLDDETEGDLT